MVFGFSGFRGSCFRLRKFEKLDWLVVMGLRSKRVAAAGQLLILHTLVLQFTLAIDQGQV